jgi:hypothetical protein
MSISASRRTLLSGGLMALFVGAVAVAAIWSPTSKSAPASLPLHGSMLNIRNHGFSPSDPCPGGWPGICSTFTATGVIKGEGVVFIDTPPVVVLDGKPTYPRAHSEARTVITTAKGELHCSEGAIFDVTPGSDHAFVDLCLITGGTGIYEGASGYIQEVGTFAFDAPDIEDRFGELDYYGKLVFGS